MGGDISPLPRVYLLAARTNMYGSHGC